MTAAVLTPAEDAADIVRLMRRAGLSLPEVGMFVAAVESPDSVEWFRILRDAGVSEPMRRLLDRALVLSGEAA